MMFVSIVQVKLRHANFERAITRGSIQILNLRYLQWRGKHLIRADERIKRAQEVLPVVTQIEHGYLSNQILEPGNYLGNRKGTVVGRAEHDEPAALFSVG